MACYSMTHAISCGTAYRVCKSEVIKIFLRLAENVQPMRMETILWRPTKDKRGVTFFVVRTVQVSL
jgi:hypothetical protein